MDETTRAQAGGRVRTIFRGTDGRGGLLTETAQTRRVAAYCRVSTDTEAQSASLETQIAAFRQRIAQRPGWKLVDIYADEGVSGTSAKKRRAFQRMLADCEAGRIDYIITKSISRFARNTLECLSYIRHLQSLGVQILFEKENIDTGSHFSEMVLTVLAAFAQEESRSTSANVTWSIRKKFEAGEARWCGWYGYRKGADGAMEIATEKAQVVRQMFALYERGQSLREIARQLNANGIPSPRGTAWTYGSVSDILKSEVYIGDMLLQKFRTVDHLSHRSVRNDATETPSYYITDHHPAIVSRETFERVQRIQAMRNRNGGHAPQYPYGGLDIRCPLCGARLVQRNTRGYGNARMALGCFTEAGCGRFALRMEKVNVALLTTYNEMDRTALQAQARRGQQPSRREAQKFLRMKVEQTETQTVEAYWLEELIARVELEEAAATEDSPAGCWTVIVHWRCGLDSHSLLRLGRTHNKPETVAKQYYVNEAKYQARRAAERAEKNVKWLQKAAAKE